MERKVIVLKAVDATAENFEDYGQIIGPSTDGACFGPSDAQLSLHNGTPRFYIMRLRERQLGFSKITHHAKVSQCLGSICGKQWYMAVAKPSIVEGEKSKIDNSSSLQDVTKGNSETIDNEPMKPSNQKKILRSNAGHYYTPPAPEEIKVFRIHGPQFMKLNVGTWHAGPLFTDTYMDFYNLELSDTNEVDHTTHFFNEGIIFKIEE
eukprot:TRINITY_DN16984_c0_g1_i1.p1 TRINITY_DN16984_c0_g1~~TRINITY_DN16984_c0_g1_i1.p1  ORF type:complete len:207 (-),score=29.06 TRINITY_DN16984_c0_g1_i1:191-811(-)